MIKKLLIGASALAMTVSVANAQEAEVLSTSTVPVSPVTAYQTQVGTVDTAAGAQAQSHNDGTERNSTTVASNSAASIISGVTGTNLPDAATLAAGNTSVVDQDGQRNRANVDQTGGTRGQAIVNQRASTINNNQFQTATVTQSETGSLSGTDMRNKAYIQQLHRQSYGGARNNATVTQTYQVNGAVSTANNAVVLQGGFGNEATNSYVEAHPANTGAITQSGAGNDAVVAQSVDFAGGGSAHGGNNAAVTQTGDSHIARVQQEDDAQATVSQFGGNANQAYVVQVDGNLNPDAISQTASIIQEGSTNFAAVSQEATNLLSTVSQIGSANVAFNRQTANSAGSTSSITQNGSTNYAEITQDAVNGNSLAVSNGDRNEIFVTQTGANAVSRVFQTNNDNSAIVYQGVQSDWSSISQNGTLNVAKVTQ